jgi:C1A family cysteine protease
MGWLKDHPDHRDRSLNHPQVMALLDQYAREGIASGGPGSIDLRQYCTAIEDQGQLGSCTAHAAIGCLEMMNKRVQGNSLDLSRLFVYKATRDMMQQKGDTGAYLRNVAGALAYFGAPPEKYWPYTISKFDTEPTAFLYSLADNYLVDQYARLDPAGVLATQIMANIKAMLAKAIPIMFGFTVYESFYNVTTNGMIPYPKPTEKVVGGHAICIVGYDDSKGCFLIRNSWGTSWGIGGYGWMPYDFLMNGLASDFWVLLSSKFTNLAQFQG